MGFSNRLALWVAATQDQGFVPDDVPQTEADALIALYNATDGDNWTDNTSWLTDTTVNNWYGVTVSGGHVKQLALNGNNLIGAIGNTLAPLTHLSAIRIDYNSITSIDISELTSLTYLYCRNNTIASLDCSNMDEDVSYLNFINNGMLQAAVNQIINDIWTRREDWVNSSPEILAGGTNATPSGIYQDVCPPTTALEQIYNLVNAQCAGDTHNTWSAAWNGGSAP